MKLVLALNDGNIDAAMQLLRSFYSSIPYDAEKQDENHRRNDQHKGGVYQQRGCQQYKNAQNNI